MRQMDEQAKISALVDAGVPVAIAAAVFAKLEAGGLTVYRKKIMLEPRRPQSSEPMTDDCATLSAPTTTPTPRRRRA